MKSSHSTRWLIDIVDVTWRTRLSAALAYGLGQGVLALRMRASVEVRSFSPVNSQILPREFTGARVNCGCQLRVSCRGVERSVFPGSADILSASEIINVPQVCKSCTPRANGRRESGRKNKYWSELSKKIFARVVSVAARYSKKYQSRCRGLRLRRRQIDRQHGVEI